MNDLLIVLALAGTAAAASIAGGLVALWRSPSTLFRSVAFGLAAGALLATITFEMIPTALEMGALPLVTTGIALGFLGVYGFDLFVYRGTIAGEKAEQRPEVEAVRRTRPPRGGETTVLAGGTSLEEVIEGIAIGVGAAVQPALALVVALSIAVDNASEGLSIGSLVRQESAGDGKPVRRVLGWTGLIAASLFGAAVVGWFVLRGMPDEILGILLGAGGGGMLYLTLTDLVPQGQAQHYEQSSAVAAGLAFILVLVLSRVAG